MADLDLQSLGMRLGEAITPTPRDAPQVRYGTIDAVNADGTLDVTIDGTTLRGMCATTGCVGAAEGMRCVVLRQGPLATVIGLVANTNLADIYLQNAHTIRGYDTDGNAREVLQVTNTNDNVVLGWGGWDASQGSTNIYGNYLNIASRNKPTINGALIGVDWNYNNTGWSVMYRQDGLVEVRKDVTANLSYGTWGSMYEAAISDFQPYPWTFPLRPSTRVEPYYVNTGGIMCIEYSPSTTQTTHFPKIWAIRPTTVSGSSIGCTLVAVGRKP